jgi:hypothetical protein
VTVSNLADLERQIAEALHHHAEIAMSQTDTEKQYQSFVADESSAVRRRRVTWEMGAAAAVTVIVIALVFGGVPGWSSNKADTVVPARDRTPVQIATNFVDALAAYDAANAARDLATSEDSLRIWPGEPSLRDGLAWAEAARFKILPKDCVRARQTGSETLIRCPFDWHFLGADQLGQPPHEGDFSVRVRGGRVEGASTSMDWSWAGLRRDALGDLPMWRPFVSWLEREHPDDVPAMIDVGEAVSARFEAPTYTRGSRALWAKYVDEWVTSQQ